MRPGLGCARTRRGHPVPPDGHAVHEHVVDAGGLIRHKTLPIGREVAHPPDGAGREALVVDDDDVSRSTDHEQSPVQLQHVRDLSRQLAHAPFERHDATIPDPVRQEIGGHDGVAQLAHVCAGIGESQNAAVALQQSAHPGDVVVGEGSTDTGAHRVRHGNGTERVERRTVPFGRDVPNGAAHQGGLGRRLGHRGLPPAAVEKPARRQVLLHPRSPGAVRVETEPALWAQRHKLGECRHDVEGRGLRHPELLFDGPTGHLDRDVHPGGPVRLVLGELFDIRRPRSHLGWIGQNGGPVDRTAEVELVEPGIVLARRDMDGALPDLGRHPDQRFGLLLRGGHGGNRATPVPQVEPGPIGGEPQCPAPDRLGHDGLHTVDLVLLRRPLVGVIPHHEEPDRRVAHVAPEVDQDTAPFDCSEVLGVCLEVPDDPGLQGSQAHVLHLVQRPQEGGAILRARRGQAVPAVTGHDGGHPLQA